MSSCQSAKVLIEMEFLSKLPDLLVVKGRRPPSRRYRCSNRAMVDGLIRQSWASTSALIVLSPCLSSTLISSRRMAVTAWNTGHRWFPRLLLVPQLRRHHIMEDVRVSLCPRLVSSAEQTNGGLAVTAYALSELIQNLALRYFQCPEILPAHCLNIFPHTSSRHVASLW